MTRIVAWTLGGSPDVKAVSTVLARLAPDVLLLAEPPGAIGIRRCLSGTALRSVSHHGRGRTGSAVCVATDVRHVTSSSVELDGGGEGQLRTASHAIVTIGGRTLSVLAMRFVGGPEGRESDARRVLDHLGSVDHPAIAGGDLAEGPGGPAGEVLRELLADAWPQAGIGPGLTYPTGEPMARHDAIHLAPSFAVAAAFVDEDAPVDAAARHRPVVIDLEDPS